MGAQDRPPAAPWQGGSGGCPLARPHAAAPPDWGVTTQPLWRTGLLLGYPVKNTISIYFGHNATANRVVIRF
jgi:hypothetical protein